MKIQYIQPAIDALERWPRFSSAQVVGCTADDIAALEALLPDCLRLPAAYREFLSYGGRKMARVFRAVDISYEMAWALLSERNEPILAILDPRKQGKVLPADLFAINEHFGDNFTFLKLSEGEDPPVYLWEDGSLEDAVREHETFSGFLHQLVLQATDPQLSESP
jgi:SMI1 / KNR4 family (SUKH-1)